MQAIYYESMMQGQNPKEVLEYYRNNNLIPAVKMAMIEDRVLHHLLDEKAGLLESKDPKASQSPKPAKKPTKAKATTPKESPKA